MGPRAPQTRRGMRLGDWLSLTACLAISFLPSVLGAWGGGTAASDWYRQLQKPPLTPPGYVFGIVWPLLYTLMGIALYLAWRSPPGRTRTIAIGLFTLQLILNALWTPIFFRWHLIGVALVEITTLWVCIFLTTVAFRKLSRPAAFLLMPYLAWVSFAVYLNAGFWTANCCTPF